MQHNRTRASRKRRSRRMFTGITESDRTVLLSCLLSMAPAAIGECNLVIVTGKALSIAAVVGHGNQPLFLGLKQLRSRRCQSRMAIQAREAIGDVSAVIKGYWPLSATPVIE